MNIDNNKGYHPRAQNEIEFGKFLVQGGAETIWGWGTPAGVQRAAKRGRYVAEAAGLKPGVKALEIGCGTGYFTQMFAKTGAIITANDISPDLIRIAQENNPKVEFICAQFEALPGDSQYDAIIGSSVLHHLDLGPALETSLRLLKPGGRLAFAEPNMLNPQIFAERTFLRKYLSNVSPDETAFVRWKLAGTLQAHGYTDIQIKPFDWLHPAIPEPFIGTVEAIGKALEWLPGLREFSGSLLISCAKPV